MVVDQEKLKEFLLDSGLLSKAEVEAAAVDAEQKKTTLQEELLLRGTADASDIRKIEAYVLGIPFVDLKGQKLAFEVLSMIPEPIARKHNIVAFRKTDEGLEVAMLDTNDLEAIDFVKKKARIKILPRLTDDNSIKAALLQYQKSLKEEFGNLIQKDAAFLKLSQKGGEDVSEEDLKKLAADLPVVRIVDTLLSHAIVQGVSDIHVEPQENQMIVRYRIDGILHDAMVLPREAASAVTARLKVLSGLKLDEKRLPQDGRFKVEAPEKVSFRVSILPTYYGEKTVLRLLKEGAQGFTLESLGFHGEALERLHHATKQTTGMILATGPTGSGKTTTLYTILDILNTTDVNISTIEDPIEYQMKRANQTQVRPDIGFSFANGLRSLVRQDPDIIMVGEIRDNETAGLAVNAALTGHLVLSTLHTNSAAGAIPRLLDMKVEPFLIVSTVKVIIAQRLVRKLHKRKEKYNLSADEEKSLAKVIDLERMLALLKDEHAVGPDETWRSIVFYKPKITPESEDGYSGRIGISEVLAVTPTIRDLVIGGATTDDIENQAKKEGMLTMIEDGMFKAVQGVTTIEEVLRVISE
ncbi:MAG: hypothetical protein COW88_02075 [Candidatus Lloydbacteria bacterium CG22_combo_CG10-13_8_21_14_all_47_15]|uniref:Bacterial type II secretion system protein E domain-containing protein n=1 Tax=Candidatus Lloydbacteria bacterium CG22_combo_CG10-13_8_21_14_all_47_15 TaxID=1974635 RepID=A0A2H0CU13_9BACT|nr:MAG: hypothetical protein COW88_02075 [Candidatus Lloydbacteria bacterium CG22_combo_CG10-13_8_21_14_all_47_15]